MLSLKFKAKKIQNFGTYGDSLISERETSNRYEGKEKPRKLELSADEVKR